MGHRTSISDYEMARAATVGPEVEGYDVEAEAEKPKSRSKKVEAAEKPAPSTSSAAKTKG